MVAPDRSKFMALFKAESEEHLTRLENDLIRLEKEPQNLELVNELNRLAHTLKGSARMMGQLEIQDAAHRLEDVFAAISGPEVAFGTEIAGRVFKDIDLIRNLLHSVDRKEEQIVPVPAAEIEYIRIPLHRINNLLNLVGEMVISKVKTEYKLSAAKMILRQAKELQKNISLLDDEFEDFFGGEGHPRWKKISGGLSQAQADIQELKSAITRLGENISLEALHTDPILEELQSSVRQMRMLPAATIFDAYPRLIRDIAQEQKKQVDFEIIGGETEIDKTILEGINPALIHLLRNAVDHGIREAGKVTLGARHEGGNVIIEVSDNGGGLDLEGIKAAALRKQLAGQEELEEMPEKEISQFIFLPGFSTAAIVTDVSGRGVGMDVVKEQTEKLRGQVEIESARGKGTRVTLKLPLTIAIIEVLMVRAGGMTFALPMLSLDESIKVKDQEISSIEGKAAIELREHTVPLVRLSEILDLAPAPGQGEAKTDVRHVVIASSLGRKIGFIVDNIVGEEEVYVKFLGEYLGRVKKVEGATVLGSGEVIVVLNVPELIESARFLKTLAPGEVRPAAAPEGGKKKILIVEDSLTTRELERSILEAQGYEVEIAVDGLEAMDKITRSKPDLILTDIRMPRLDGLELCRTLKQKDEYKEIPVIIVTAFQSDEDKRRGLEAGAQAYITKSTFDQRNLLDTVERLIG